MSELLAAVTDEPSPGFLSALKTRLENIDLGASGEGDRAVEVPLNAVAMPVGRRQWTRLRFVAVVAVAAAILVIVLYGIAALPRGRRFEQPPTASTAPSVTSFATSTTATTATTATAAGATSTPSTQPPPTTLAPTSAPSTQPSTTPPGLEPPGTAATSPASRDFSAIAGLYLGSTGGSGDLVIGTNGLAQFTAPNTVACPTCSNADAPQGTIEIALVTLTSADDGGYSAVGTITAESDRAWATEIGSTPSEKPIGSAVNLVVSASGQLSLSFLPPEDVLTRFRS